MIVVLLGSATAVSGQSRNVSTRDLSQEPHHKLLFKNDKVRVYRLDLARTEVAAPHRHERPYAYIALTPATIANEVKGRAPVISSLEFGEVRTSKGGFTVAERNAGDEPLSVIVVEQADKMDHPGSFPTPNDFRMHNAAIGHIFETDDWRGYELNIASQGTIQQHKEPYDRLIVALSDLHLRRDIEGKGAGALNMQMGEIAWLKGGDTEQTTNVGDATARFVVIEFR